MSDVFLVKITFTVLGMVVGIFAGLGFWKWVMRGIWKEAGWK